MKKNKERRIKMMLKGNYYQPFSLRIFEKMHYKPKLIAIAHKRPENKEIIKQYEKENGPFPPEPINEA